MKEESQTVKREEVLLRAKDCVCGDREQDYGSPGRNFETIAGLWNAYLGDRLAEPDRKSVV